MARTKANGSDNYIAGAQDNGTHISNVAAGADANTSYQRVLGGDGFEVIWHYDSINKFIGGFQYNGFYRFVNGQGFFAGNGDYGSGSSPFYSKISNAKQQSGNGFQPIDQWGVEIYKFCRNLGTVPAAPVLLCRGKQQCAGCRGINCKSRCSVGRVMP